MAEKRKNWHVWLSFTYYSLDNTNGRHSVLHNTEKSLRLVVMEAKFSVSQQTVVLQIWQKNEKIDMYDFPLHMIR